MSTKNSVLITGAVLVSFAVSIGSAIAAETGTKTMFFDSSIYPPYRQHTSSHLYNFAPRHRECYLPSGPCDNDHRVQN
jgi:hypothetical protein